MLVNGNGKAEKRAGAVELSFVVPCRNEERNLGELYRRIEAAARGVAESFELVLVNDGSTDGTWRVMTRLATEHAEVLGVSLSRSFGQQAALAAGLSMATGERVITLDADLQDPPELVEQLLAMMDAGYDVVHARRRSRGGESLFKRATAAAFYRLLNWLSDTRVEPDSGEFRLYSRRAVDAVVQLREPRRMLRGLAHWIGFRQAVVEYDRLPRKAGRTKFHLCDMLCLAGDALTAFSIRPLRVAMFFSLFCCAAAAISGSLGLWRLIAGHNWGVWLLAAALVCGLAGMQLFMLGVIGEYLGRLYEKSLGRPLFIIDEVVHGDVVDANGAGLGGSSLVAFEEKDGLGRPSSGDGRQNVCYQATSELAFETRRAAKSPS